MEPTPKKHKRPTVRERRAEAVRTAVNSGAWDAIALACSHTSDRLLRDMAWQPDPVGQVAALAQQWRAAIQDADRHVCAACVLKMLNSPGADFQTVVLACHGHYAMTVQEVILALNDLLRQRVITVKSGFYVRADTTLGE